MSNKIPIVNAAITGASSGIGKAVAEWIARHGAQSIHFCGRNEERVRQTEQELRAICPNCFGSVLDVVDKDAVRAWLEKADSVAPLDLVLANAGRSTGGKEDDEAAVRAVLQTNIFGVVNTVYPALDLYRRNGDGRAARRIAMLSSMAGYHGMPQCPAYSASKCSVKALGAALRGRCHAEGIQVSTICPGFVRSRITDENTCPMPFFKEADEAADIICKGIIKGKGLISFPTPMRFGSWLLGALPEVISERLMRKLPPKN